MIFQYSLCKLNKKTKPSAFVSSKYIIVNTDNNSKRITIRFYCVNKKIQTLVVLFRGAIVKLYITIKLY